MKANTKTQIVLRKVFKRLKSKFLMPKYSKTQTILNLRKL